LIAREGGCLRRAGCGALGRVLQDLPYGRVRAAAIRTAAGEGLTSRARAEGIVLPASLQQARPARKREYLAGRLCARKALGELLGPEAAATADLAAGGDGVPQWPAGVVGSISHGAGMGLAAAAAGREYGGLGVEVEGSVAAERAAKLSRRVVSEAEAELRRCSPFSLAEWFTLVFSAKESAYKALFPLERQVLGFADIALVRCRPMSQRGGRGRFDLELESAAGRAVPYRCLEGLYGFTAERGKRTRVWTVAFGLRPGARRQAVDPAAT